MEEKGIVVVFGLRRIGGPQAGRNNGIERRDDSYSK